MDENRHGGVGRSGWVVAVPPWSRNAVLCIAASVVRISALNTCASSYIGSFIAQNIYLSCFLFAGPVLITLLRQQTQARISAWSFGMVFWHGLLRLLLAQGTWKRTQIAVNQVLVLSLIEVALDNITLHVYPLEVIGSVVQLLNLYRAFIDLSCIGSKDEIIMYSKKWILKWSKHTCTHARRQSEDSIGLQLLYFFL